MTREIWRIVGNLSERSFPKQSSENSPDRRLKGLKTELACEKCKPVRQGDPDWIQTSDLLLRRQLLYSAELPDLTVLNRGAKIKESVKISYSNL